MDKLRESLNVYREKFDALDERTRFLASAGALGVMVLLVLLILLVMSQGINTTRRRMASRSAQLQQLVAMESDFKIKKATLERKKRKLKRNKTSLVKLVEDAAKASGMFDLLKDLKPDKGEANEEGIVESTLDLKASGLSADRLQDFLIRLKESSGVIIIRRLSVTRPHKKDTLNIEMVLLSYASA